MRFIRFGIGAREMTSGRSPSMDRINTRRARGAGVEVSVAVGTDISVAVADGGTVAVHVMVGADVGIEVAVL